MRCLVAECDSFANAGAQHRLSAETLFLDIKHVDELALKRFAKSAGGSGADLIQLVVGFPGKVFSLNRGPQQPQTRNKH